MSNILNITGVNEKESANVISALRTLLADLQVYYTNLRGLHWHIAGCQFFVLHAQFEKMYDDTAEKVDEVAERLLQLGASPENRFSELLKQSQIAEVTNISEEGPALDNIFDSIATLIKQERIVLAAAEKADDQVSADLIGGYLAEQEKLVWMLSAYRK